MTANRRSEAESRQLCTGVATFQGQGQIQKYKKGGPVEFFSKKKRGGRGGPITYSGKFVLEINKTFSKRGGLDPPGSAPDGPEFTVFLY